MRKILNKLQRAFQTRLKSILLLLVSDGEPTGDKMLRLIVAIGVAALLLPEEVRITAPKSASQIAMVEPVTTLDTLSAAQSLYADITGFCTRNEEACMTGKAIVTNIAHTAQSALSSLQNEAADPVKEQELDPVRTATISREEKQIAIEEQISLEKIQ